MSKLNRACFQPAKQLSISQNFMTNRRLLERIVDLSTITKDDTVIEIGTGKGHLTQSLCGKGGFILSIELDDRLFQHARSKLTHLSNLRLIHADFLKYPLPASGAYKVFANIPYAITTQIVKKLTDTSNPPSDIWLVMEKGAAKRFMGLPADNKHSLQLKINWALRILYHFRKDDFHPLPAVDSVLLCMSRKEKPDLNRYDATQFNRFISHSLDYGLFGKRSLLSKKQIATALKLAKLPPVHMNATLSYVQWLCLFRCFQQFNRTKG